MSASCKNAQVDWDDLRFVLAVARHRSLARAGAALGVTHTTVGRRLAALERAVGVRLFERTPTGFVPTDSGRDLMATGEQIEAEVLAAEARVRGQDSALQGEVRLSTLDVLFERYRAAFASFVQRYPNVVLTVSAPLDQVSLTRREADVALRMTNTPPEHLVGRKVGRMSFGVYGSDTVVKRIGADAPLDSYPWVGWDERSPIGHWFGAWAAEHAPGLKVVLRTDESTLVRRSALLAGIGVQLLARSEGDALPGVSRIGPEFPQFDRDVWLLTLRELRQATRIRAVMDHLDAEIRGTG